MVNFEILCVTMHQNDFSKINEMNIHTNVVFANQCDCTTYDEYCFEGYTAKMISTQTRGVGINRNLALMYASAKYCLLADDDVIYYDNVEQLVVSEFEAHPDADVIIFHLDSDNKTRELKKFKHTKRWHRYNGLPVGGVRIAFKLESIRKANTYFSMLFGGGSIFSSGEDSLFLIALARMGERLYLSKETIGKVSFASSSWFCGFNERYYYGKGAFYQAARPSLKYLWMLYLLVRTYNKNELRFTEKLRWMNYGAKGYKSLLSFEQFCTEKGITL